MRTRGIALAAAVVLVGCSGDALAPDGPALLRQPLPSADANLAGPWKWTTVEQLTFPNWVAAMFEVAPEGKVTHARCETSGTMTLRQMGGTLSGTSIAREHLCTTRGGQSFESPGIFAPASLSGAVRGRSVELIEDAAVVDCVRHLTILLTRGGRVNGLDGGGRCIVPGHPASNADFPPPPAGTSKTLSFSAVSAEPPPPAGSVLARVQALALDSLDTAIQTYYSAGARERAEELEEWLRTADIFFRDRLEVSQRFRLAVLGEEDWAQISRNPYGVPFFSPEPHVIVLPAIPEAAAVTQIYRAARVGLPAHAAQDLADVGVTYDEAVLQVLDLIGFHEVGHVYVNAFGFNETNTARWLEELLATYVAYSFLAVWEPDAITVWDALSEAVIGFVDPASRSLDDFNSPNILALGPATYGWFQSHFNLRDAVVVVERPDGSWLPELVAAGLAEDTQAMATSDLLARLDATLPGFTDWASSSGLEFR